MSKASAGLILYRRVGKGLQVLLVHPGGPFWKNKDSGAWSIPKGEFLPGQDPLVTAKREFREELGKSVSGEFERLNPVRQAGGKIIYAFALEHDFDVSRIKSNTFDMEWPPKSGRMQAFPEIDRAEWCDLKTAREKMNPAQTAFLDQLTEMINS